MSKCRIQNANIKDNRVINVTIRQLQIGLYSYIYS